MKKYTLSTLSIIGHRTWITNIGEPVETGEGKSPIVSMSSNKTQAKEFTEEEALKNAPEVLKVRQLVIIEEVIENLGA